MSTKPTYRIRNWNDYNESLKQRGSITFWFDEEILAQWHNIERSGQRGRPLLYSDIAIECALTLRAIFHLPLRATEGFMESLIELANLKISCPDYTTLCKRQGKLEIALPQSGDSIGKGAIDIVVDSTGLKVFGEGEWKVRQHGWNYRRRWRKVHVAVNAKCQMIEVVVMSTNDFKDSEILPDLLSGVGADISSVAGDGAYDSHDTYNHIAALGAKAIIPPRKDAVISQRANGKSPPLARDEVIRAIRKSGRKQWKKESGYHRRSLAETAMFRLKTIFGSQLRSRIFDNQCVESFIRCAALNKMFIAGKPDSYLVN